MIRLCKVGSLKKNPNKQNTKPTKNQPQTKSESNSSFEGEHEDANKKQHYILINAMQLTQD